MMPPMSEPIHYELIDTPPAMAAAMAALAPATSLALDLEMENSFRRYGLHIALIQVSTPDRKNYIFDPLSGIDIPSLGALLTRQATELIVHDADFDRRACRQVFRWTLTHVFDTKIAAQLAGFRQFGLGSLLQELLGIQVNKKYQTFDWLKRPIRRDALDYAARDTASLHDLKAILVQRLTELGRLAWAHEEFLRLEIQEPEAPAGPVHHRIKRSSLLSPRQLAILGALAGFRDQVARRLNRPVFYIMRDPVLLQFAVHPPADANALRAIRGMHPAMYRPETMAQFFEALARGRAAPEETHPFRKKRPPVKPGCAQRLKAMQDWRRQAAAPQDLEPHLLLSNDLLQWCARHPGEPPPAAIASELRQWQRELLWKDFQGKFNVPDSPA